MKCRRLPRLLFDAAPHWPRPRGPKGAHLKEETKRNRFPLYSSLIRVLGAEQSAPKDRLKFSEKGSKCRRPPTFRGMPTFWHVLDRSCQYKQPCQYGRHAAHISWAGLRTDHLGTAWRPGNTFWEESSSRGLRSSWRRERPSAGLSRRQSGETAEPK